MAVTDDVSLSRKQSEIRFGTVPNCGFERCRFQNEQLAKAVIPFIERAFTDDLHVDEVNR